MTDLKIMPVEMCNHIGKCQGSPSGYASYLESRFTHSKPSDARVAEYALQQLAEARKKDEETHAKNAPALLNNKEVAQAVMAFMDGIGMPRSYSERDLKSRARYPKTILRNLGEGWDGDGRCFRDCEWNFDRLIASLPDQLAADINTAWSRSGHE